MGYINPLTGFVIDKTSFEAELANMQETWKQYNKSLTYGVLPVDETLAEIKAIMEKAGCEKVRTEVSKQIADFLASK